MAKQIIVIVITLFVAICILETITYPLIVPPHAERAWYHIAPLAFIGLIVGIPVVILTVSLGMLGMSNSFIQMISFLALILWCYWVYRICYRCIVKRNMQRRTKEKVSS
ncbi:MAG: hypothetical protein KJ887_06085 [Candidatus Omnitrophica bacterium]|nr:hypothetical protein [Candidatus Omnitrophota bacterium]MBU1047212.1 hypothetical protein [Candidatus Omnitrophota bacterium]MBU1630621.1 hypothetical protein [Candidatus Omnitrophota bacterium]MBU1767049.1 hypothetical protein [Candidatus Omnitrophota bacterium]MBU1889512.1 hypothetical protein [Candidatus Omnitrophota bacterium]